MGVLDHSCRVLVVDDDPVIRTLVRAICEDEGARVREAANGEEALRLLDEASASVIVLDLTMPVMNGPAFACKLRERGDATPIIVLSAHDAHHGGRELGAARSIDKPFDMDELLEAVQALCHGVASETRDAGAGSVPMDREGAHRPRESAGGR